VIKCDYAAGRDSYGTDGTIHRIDNVISPNDVKPVWNYDPAVNSWIPPAPYPINQWPAKIVMIFTDRGPGGVPPVIRPYTNAADWNRLNTGPLATGVVIDPKRTASSVSSAYGYVAAQAGASLVRDTTDTRIINELRGVNGQFGSIRISPMATSNPNGYLQPTYNTEVDK
jgi:hypothetical protein